MHMHAGIHNFSMPSDDAAARAAASLRLLADPTRIKVLWALMQGESSVACLADLVGATPTGVSQHLAKLRLAGLVRHRREGMYVYYEAADKGLERILAEALGEPMPKAPAAAKSRHTLSPKRTR
jgi:DNA-binding transcriptional ArsR family regulator